MTNRICRRFGKPSNAVTPDLRHTFTAYGSSTTLSALGQTAQQQMERKAKQRHLSAPLCLFFRGWLAACRPQIRSWMCWPDTLGLNTDLSRQLCLQTGGVNISENSLTQTSTAGKPVLNTNLLHCCVYLNQVWPVKGSCGNAWSVDPLPFYQENKPSHATTTIKRHVISLRSSQIFRREIMLNGCRFRLCTPWSTCLIFSTASHYTFVVGSISLSLLGHKIHILVLYIILSILFDCIGHNGCIPLCKLKIDNSLNCITLKGNEINWFYQP